MTREFLEGLEISEEAIEAILNKAEEMNRLLEEEKSKGAKMAQDIEIGNVLKQFGAKNDKAVKALLDIAAAENSDDFSLSLKEQLKKLKEENEYLFGDDNTPRIVGRSGKTGENKFGFKFTGVR